MKITAVDTTTFNAPLKTPFVTALRRVDALEDLVVVIRCDNGMVGYGEGAPTPQITGETIGSIQAAIDYITPHLLNKSLDDFEHLIQTVQQTIVKNTTAKSALEIALYDLKAQAAQQPLYCMLGGTQTTFRTDITISMNPTEVMVADAKKAVSLGYDTLKIKIGESPEMDAKRTLAIAKALPSHITLRLDANQGWSAKESVTLLQQLEAEGVVAEFIEQPVAADDTEGLKYIRQRVKTPVLADESVFSLKDAKKLLEMEAVDYLNIKLAKTGGISQALALAELAEIYGVKCMIGCMLEGPFSVAAGVHVASAKANTITMLDLDAVALLASHPAHSDIVFDESHITLADAAGLGVRL
jgi:o-succinylbenzoate synthase